MNNQTVRNWMTPDPITISPQTTLPEAQQIMFEHRFRRLPVVDRSRLVGILTLGDIREANPSDATTLSVYELNYLLDRLLVKDIMTANPVTVSPDDMIGEAARLLVEHKIGGLPVTEGELVIGIITETDLCRLLMQEQPEVMEFHHAP
jgi:CBS domain-containing protein